MLKIDVIGDEDLQGVCKKFISSLLPHEKYNSMYYTAILNTVFQYITLDEFTMEYRAMFEALNSLGKIKIAKMIYVPKLFRESFETLLENNLANMVIDPRYGVEEYLKEERLAYNLEIPTVKAEAVTMLYHRCMDLYDECLDLEIPTDEVLNYTPVLSKSFQVNAIQTSIKTQVRLLEGPVRIERKVYLGVDDWGEYVSMVAKEVRARVDGETSGLALKVDSIDKERVMIEDLIQSNTPLANYGIPDIDDYTPMLRHRLVIFVANEGVGKTMIIKDLVTKLVLEGKSVLIMCGETKQSKMWNDIVVSYIWKKYGYKVIPEEVLEPEQCSDEMRKIIGIAKSELRVGGLIRYKTSFTYGHVYDELKQEYELEEFDAVFIDHSLRLNGNLGTPKMNVDSLAGDVERFKVDYPVFVGVASHPSATAKNSIGKNLPVTEAPTRESQALSTDADEVFVLYDNIELRRMDKLIWFVYKRRGPKVGDMIFYINKEFDVNSWSYDDKSQANEDQAGLEAEDIFRELEQDYEDII